MKITLYMAMSINGMVASIQNETPWSKREFEKFFSYAKKAGNIVIGRKTYELMKECKELDHLKNITIAVLTTKKNLVRETYIFLRRQKRALLF